VTQLLTHLEQLERELVAIEVARKAIQRRMREVRRMLRIVS
jgi:hypothetical protein